jgi:hypothetical protein
VSRPTCRDRESRVGRFLRDDAERETLLIPRRRGFGSAFADRGGRGVRTWFWLAGHVRTDVWWLRSLPSRSDPLPAHVRALNSAAHVRALEA